MRSATLGVVCEEGGGFVQTGPFGSQLHASDYVSDGVPCVMPQDIADNSISTQDIARVSEEDADRLARHRLGVGDIVYSRRGDVERRALVRAAESGWLCGTGCLRVHFGADPVVSAAYISYYLGLESSRTWIRQHAVGATMPNLNTSILSAVPLHIHELPEQRAIAEVLGALDDKIAASERLIASADDVVRAWYDQLSADASDERSLGDIAVNVRDQVRPGDDPEGLYVGLEHLPRRRMWGGEWGAASQVDSAKSKFERGDVLFGKLRPYFHKVVASPGGGICSTDILVIRPKDGLSGLVLAAAASDGAVELANAHSAGTRMPRASWASLAQVQVAWPGDAQARVFSERVDVLSERCLGAARESRTLAALRDALLPELMSGRLTVKDAESQVEEVV